METFRFGTRCLFCDDIVSVRVPATYTREQACLVLDKRIDTHLRGHVDEILEEVERGPQRDGRGKVRPADQGP